MASTALGTIATMVTGRTPGVLLGAFVVVGTVAAALVVRPRAGRMILPVPVLSYLVAALASGIIYNRGTGASRTMLAIDAAQWIASGFFPMALATILAIVIIIVRWYLWRRRRPARAATSGRAGRTHRPPRPPALPADPDTLADSGYPQTWKWDEPGARGYRRSGPRAGSGPRTGSGPYNFSSGA